VLEADIKACFDTISHEWLIDNIPVDKTILQKWLKAGFVYQKQLFPTESGTPQGGIISPVLANMTLDGLEKKLAKAFPRAARQGLKMNMVRYADDLIITGYSKEWLEQKVMPVLVTFLAERGLTLSPEKTRITHITEGFDFLGWNIRKYHGKLLMKPSKASIQAHLDRVREIIKANKTAKQMSLIGLLNPVLRGWANYHCHIVAKKTFSLIDAQVWSALWRWAKRRHPNKSARWVKAKYYKTRGYRDWMFTAIDESNKHKKLSLVLEADTPIKRHVQIKGMANPHDPVWTQYFEARRNKQRTKSTQWCCRVPQGAFAEA
jgi:RNA-directed DNA polymerase